MPFLKEAALEQTVVNFRLSFSQRRQWEFSLKFEVLSWIDAFNLKLQTSNSKLIIPAARSLHR